MPVGDAGFFWGVVCAERQHPALCGSRGPRHVEIGVLGGWEGENRKDTGSLRERYPCGASGLR